MNSKHISVYVRIRPPLNDESDNGLENLSIKNNNTIALNIPKNHQNISKMFKFDGILDSAKSQMDVFDSLSIKSILTNVINGYNSTIFAYGQTGSGKTFTIEGKEEMIQCNNGKTTSVFKCDSESNGIVPRAIETLNSMIGDNPNYFIHCSFLQIYNERIYDLFNPPKSVDGITGGLKMRWKAGKEFYVENLYKPQCTKPTDLLQYYKQGVNARTVSSHSMNKTSSRSHSIFQIYISHIVSNEYGSSRSKESVLCFVDLAGSEKISQTNATGRILTESIHINKSLHMLRMVIDALAKMSSSLSSSPHSSSNTSYIPYRDSKLTSLLKQSLGGNSITIMIACLSPSDLYTDENLSTLQYASKAMNIKVVPQINKDAKSIQIDHLKEENLRLLKEIEEIKTRMEKILHYSPSDPICPLCHQLKSDFVNSNDLPHPPSGEPLKSNSNTSSFRSMKIQNQLNQNQINNELEKMKYLIDREQELHNEMKQFQNMVKMKNEENSILSNENNQLRERIEILESLLLSPIHIDSIDEIYVPGYGLIRSKPVYDKPCKISIVEEIIKLREENQILKEKCKNFRETSPIVSPPPPPEKEEIKEIMYFQRQPTTKNKTKTYNPYFYDNKLNITKNDVDNCYNLLKTHNKMRPTIKPSPFSRPKNKSKNNKKSNQQRSLSARPTIPIKEDEFHYHFSYDKNNNIKKPTSLFSQRIPDSYEEEMYSFNDRNVEDLIVNDTSEMEDVRGTIDDVDRLNNLMKERVKLKTFNS